MIIRAEKKSNYTILSNEFLLDENISDKARGLLARLLSRPDNWNLNINHLVKTGKDGHTAVRSRIQELITAGYIETDVRRLANGRITGMEYIIRERPMKPCGDGPPPEQQAQPCNDTAPREVQGELFNEITQPDSQSATQADKAQPREVRNENTGIRESHMRKTVIKETAPVIKTDVKQILKETTTTPAPEPVSCDQAMPLPPSSFNLEILNLIPEKHKSPLVISLVNKAIVEYPPKEVAQAVAYAACNVRGGRMQFKAYLDKTLKNRWADGWEPEHDEKQAARQEALAQLKRLPDSNLKFLAEAGNIVALKELRRRELKQQTMLPDNYSISNLSVFPPIQYDIPR